MGIFCVPFTEFKEAMALSLKGFHLLPVLYSVGAFTIDEVVSSSYVSKVRILP